MAGVPDRGKLRHAALAADLIDLVAAGDVPGLNRLIEQLAADREVDPWGLVICVAALAVRRPYGRSHPVEAPDLHPTG